MAPLSHFWWRNSTHNAKQNKLKASLSVQSEWVTGTWAGQIGPYYFQCLYKRFRVCLHMSPFAPGQEVVCWHNNKTTNTWRQEIPERLRAPWVQRAAVRESVCLPASLAVQLTDCPSACLPVCPSVLRLWWTGCALWVNPCLSATYLSATGLAMCWKISSCLTSWSNTFWNLTTPTDSDT